MGLLHAVSLLAQLAASAGQAAPVPEGHAGIAARYPGDVGIERDPAVLLAEDFEKDPKVVPWMRPGGWFDLDYGPGKGTEITDRVPAAGGRRCLQYNLRKGKQGSGGMFHLVKPGECVHYRYCRMFEKDWEWPRGYGPHDAMLFGGKWTAPTDTDLSIYLDFWMTADTVVRVASAKQKLGYGGWHDYLRKRYGPTPVGAQGFPWNRSKPDKIEPMKWHCSEFMVRLSTPGKEDGIVRLWVNGKLVSDFTDVPLRDENHPELLLNMVFLAPYFHPGSPKDQVHWADQIVIAASYVGPVAQGKPAARDHSKVPAPPAEKPPELSPEEKAARDLLAEGERLLREGEVHAAKAFFERVREKFPGTRYAEKAGEHLERMK